jgi:alpha-L-fucosidase 2
MRIYSVLASCLMVSVCAWGSSRTYELWEPNPAQNRGSRWEQTKSSERPNSRDVDWESWSYPLGNGYVGACIFGRTDTERIQITDTTVHNKGKYGIGG